MELHGPDRLAGDAKPLHRAALGAGEEVQALDARRDLVEVGYEAHEAPLDALQQGVVSQEFDLGPADLGERRRANRRGTVQGARDGLVPEADSEHRDIPLCGVPQ